MKWLLDIQTPETKKPVTSLALDVEAFSYYTLDIYIYTQMPARLIRKPAWNTACNTTCLWMQVSICQFGWHTVRTRLLTSSQNDKRLYELCPGLYWIYMICKIYVHAPCIKLRGLEAHENMKAAQEHVTWLTNSKNYKTYLICLISCWFVSMNAEYLFK